MEPEKRQLQRCPWMEAEDHSVLGLPPLPLQIGVFLQEAQQDATSLVCRWRLRAPQPQKATQGEAKA